MYFVVDYFDDETPGYKLICLCDSLEEIAEWFTKIADRHKYLPYKVLDVEGDEMNGDINDILKKEYGWEFE